MKKEKVAENSKINSVLNTRKQLLVSDKKHWNTSSTHP